MQTNTSSQPELLSVRPIGEYQMSDMGDLATSASVATHQAEHVSEDNAVTNIGNDAIGAGEYGSAEPVATRQTEPVSENDVCIELENETIGAEEYGSAEPVVTEQPRSFDLDSFSYVSDDSVNIDYGMCEAQGDRPAGCYASYEMRQVLHGTALCCTVAGTVSGVLGHLAMSGSIPCCLPMYAPVAYGAPVLCGTAATALDIAAAVPKSVYLDEDNRSKVDRKHRSAALGAALFSGALVAEGALSFATNITKVLSGSFCGLLMGFSGAASAALNAATLGLPNRESTISSPETGTTDSISNRLERSVATTNTVYDDADVVTSRMLANVERSMARYSL